jgi:hypothetical protein
MVHQASRRDGDVWRQGLAAWLLLLSILTHALVPIGSPFQRTAGSAFSTATSDVAVTPKRQQRAFEENAIKGGGGQSEEQSRGSGDPPAGLSVQLSTIQPQLERTVVPSSVPHGLVPLGGAAPFSARAPPTI